MEALLGEFHRGNIADRDRTHEDTAIRTCLAELTAAWDLVFPPFPECRWKRRTAAWEARRGRRDAYLRSLIVACVPEHDAGRRLIVNPATVAGRHARMLARALPGHEVIGTDVDPRWQRNYHLVTLWFHSRLSNYRFVRESIYEPDLRRRPAAIVFFGACGSLTDGCMDHAIAVRSPFLICRSCCHDNIGGNTEIVRRPGFINWFFAMKNWGFRRYRRRRKWPYVDYFSDRYGKDAYPRSRMAREIMDTETILAIARNSVDSDICRSLIDLDRCQYLRENGYHVMYREELFFAHRQRAA
jgi:hypothetical protein